MPATSCIHHPDKNLPVATRLVSEDLYEAARARVWADRVNRECCSPYYTILVRTEDEDRRTGYETLLAGLRAFSAELAKTPGPTFLAEGQLSTVDIALIPWAYRFYVFDTYRGPTYSLSRDDPNLENYWQWFDHVMNLPQVASQSPAALPLQNAEQAPSCVLLM